MLIIVACFNRDNGLAYERCMSTEEYDDARKVYFPFKAV